MDATAEKAIKVLTDRRAIYMQKHEAADPFAEDMFNRWEHTKVLVEAFDIALMELCGRLGIPKVEPLIVVG